MSELTKAQIARRKQPGYNTKANSKYHAFKVCTSCDKRKRLSQFSIVDASRRAANPRKYSSQCKMCKKPADARKVDPNFKPDRKKLKENERKATDKRRRSRATRIKLLEYLADKGCESCDEHDPRVLEFDHIDPRTKYKSISRMVTNGYGWASDVLRSEIRKCRILCANCHRKHTVTQQEYHSHADTRAALQEIFARHGITE